MRITIQMAIVMAIYAVGAFAAGTGLLPWEGPLSRITNSLTGPVAFGLGIAGIGAAGGTLLFHGDLGEFGKRGCQAGLACSTLVLAPGFVTNVFGVTGALL
jgi:type IV secretion system protein VirB2